ncbi:Rieske (2Fe-2S) protein [Streptomyces sp. NBC_00102]|uniref:Rieske (2Fe-2S) protein n=1 Tax=Streptomyces sp. NBC_00102 TaxID=2975652 RepID=UPI002251FC70|nr:Rieske (2Fe-2S) protein [Streptomyces sp. NBC_00102]MCX5395720.1 Rieske (2Fe-2S) protein [Streptomyces sp. NBC_00102]
MSTTDSTSTTSAAQERGSRVPAPREQGFRPGRRAVVVAVGAAGAAVALSACGADGSDAKGGSEAKSGTVLGSTGDVPEGGGKVFAEQGVVVTQPTAGEFKAFSSTCTHQGCAVSGVTNGAITCPCHQSTFDPATGEPTGGPATVALPAKEIKVADGSITLA